MKNVGLYTSARNVACNAIADLVDIDGGGTTGCHLKIYGGGIDGTHLATIHLANPAFGDAALGVCTGAAVSANETSAIAGSPAADSFTLETAAGLVCLSGTVGVGADFDLNFNTTNITLGSAVNLDSIQITVPETSANV